MVSYVTLADEKLASNNMSSPSSLSLKTCHNSLPNQILNKMSRVKDLGVILEPPLNPESKAQYL